MSGKKPNYGDSKSKLKQMAKTGQKLQKKVKTRDQFNENRELLECTCGLLEDVTLEGRLFTYHKNGLSFKDTGLRFIKINEDTFCCPECKTMLKAKPL